MLDSGRQRKTWGQPRAVQRKAGVNPPKGFVVLIEGSFNFGWRGEFGAREGSDRGDMTNPGVRLKRPAANSSTMRGGKGAERSRHRLPVILVGDGAEPRIVIADSVRESL